MKEFLEEHGLLLWLFSLVVFALTATAHSADLIQWFAGKPHDAKATIMILIGGVGFIFGYLVGRMGRKH